MVLKLFETRPSFITQAKLAPPLLHENKTPLYFMQAKGGTPLLHPSKNCALP